MRIKFKTTPALVPVVVVSFATGYFLGLKQLQGHYNYLMESKLDAAEAEFEKKLETAGEQAVKEYEEWLTQAEQKGVDELRAAVEEVVTSYQPDNNNPTPLETIIPSKPSVPAINYAAVYQLPERSIPSTQSADTVDTTHSVTHHAKPVLITEEQFFADELGHEQVQLTYYAGDQVLSNMEDEVIEGDERDRWVGDLLGLFVADDANTLYVRSFVAEKDFEISRSAGSYTHEVLGLGDGQ